ncbi:MAG: type IX secretion system protein PorQ [Bacteroidota bacterium]
MRFYLLILFASLAAYTSAQIGGTSTYQFLSLQPNARIAALGGYAIATRENDVNLASQNPALLTKEMDNQVGYNHVFYFDGIGAGYVTYAKHKDSVGTFSAGLQYISYGTFRQTSSTGDVLGEFTAAEYCFQAGYAKTFNKLSVGGQLKFIYSTLESYTSLGIATDLAATYYDPEKLFTLSVVAANLGTQIKTYRAGNNETLPFNLQVGVSKKFAHAPFRFSLVAHNLQNPGGLLYNNPNKPGLKRDLETGQPIPESFNAFDQVLSHINLSGELLLGKNFYVGLGYNHLRRWEMKLEETGGMTGFAWGFGLRLSKFQVAYGRTGYHVGHSTNHISFIVFMNEYLKKKKTAS